MPKKELLEILERITQGLSSSIFEMDELKYDWPKALRGYLLELNQDLDALIQDVKDKGVSL